MSGVYCFITDEWAVNRPELKIGASLPMIRCFIIAGFP
jgi:hypothetical protein